jgi:hypothetical protein
LKRKLPATTAGIIKIAMVQIFRDRMGLSFSCEPRVASPGRIVENNPDVDA